MFEVQCTQLWRGLPHLGSTLRGMFGHGLLATACCGQQPHSADCRYVGIFEPRPPHGWPKRFSDCPPAFVITPPPFGSALGQRHFRFGMTLMGVTSAESELVLTAWQHAATHGLGVERVGAKITVSQRETRLPVFGRGSLLCWRFETPVLLKHKQPGARARQLSAGEVDLAALLHALHRRLELTHRLYGVPALPLAPLSTWLAQAEQLECQTFLEDVHFSRHSNRQGRNMPLSGVIGRVFVHGSLSEDLLQALVLGQWLHIGGKTSFGLGGYSIQFVDAPGARLCIED